MMRALVIDFGANVNASGYQNNTPLHEAALNNHLKSCEFLLQNGANAQMRNSFGVTPLELAKDEKVIDLFKKHSSCDVACTSKQSCEDNDQLQRSQYDTKVVTVKSEPMPSTMANGRARKQAPKKVLLFGTGMTPDQKVQLNSLASQLKIKVAKEMSQNGSEIVLYFIQIFTTSNFNIYLKS